MVSSKVKFGIRPLGIRPARANARPTSGTLARHRAVAKQMSLLTEYHCLVAKKESSRVSPQTKRQH